MKRFNLFRFVFALVCGCYINGVKSQSCNSGQYMNKSGICTDCNCDQHGSRSQSCHTPISGYGRGQCPCYFDSYAGRRCDQCVSSQVKSNGHCCYTGDYYDTDDDSCKNCGCKNRNGVDTCSKGCGVKTCKKGYKGPDCDQCADKYYMSDSNAKKCSPCNCPLIGTKNLNCDNNGQCSCYQNSYTGLKCQKCVAGQRMTNGRCCYHGDYSNVQTSSCEKCGCDITGSQNTQCDDKGKCTCKKGLRSGAKCDDCTYGYYLDNNGKCQRPPDNDQTPVVKNIKGLETCGASDTTLKVLTKKKYTLNINSLDDCQNYCQSDIECIHAVNDKNEGENRTCSFTWKKSFGTKAKHIITGPGECPKTGKCVHPGVDYYRGSKYWPIGYDIKSPKDCQKHCRHIGIPYGISLSFNYGLKNRVCFCKASHSFLIGPEKYWVSGDIRCPRCFGYKYDLSYLENVDNGSPQPFLIKATVEACQLSCKANRLCKQFQFDPWTGKCHLKNYLTARVKGNNVAFASRDCKKIIACGYCNPEGVSKCSLFGKCLCNKFLGYTGTHCSTCLAKHFKDGNKCIACDCDQYGSRSRSCHTPISGYGKGQCPCYFDSYTGRRCDQCVRKQIKSNGRCCFKGDYFNLKAGRCNKCGCFLRGSPTWLCHLYPGGQCQCRSTYKGRQCNEVEGRTITASNDFYYDYKYHRVIAISCSGRYYCDILSVRAIDFDQALYLEGSETITKNKGHTILYTKNFCFGYKLKGNQDVVCKDGDKAFSGSSNTRTAYFHLHANTNVQLGNVKLAVNISNFYNVTFLLPRDIPLEPNP